MAGTIGQNDKSYIGGFVGQQVGTDIQNCSVKNSTYAITSKEYGGGFSGICRDADIQGTLSDVGIELVRVTQPQSLLLNCNLTDSNVTVEGENYQEELPEHRRIVMSLTVERPEAYQSKQVEIMLVVLPELQQLDG